MKIVEFLSADILQGGRITYSYVISINLVFYLEEGLLKRCEYLMTLFNVPFGSQMEYLT